MRSKTVAQLIQSWVSCVDLRKIPGSKAERKERPSGEDAAKLSEMLRTGPVRPAHCEVDTGLWIKALSWPAETRAGLSS